MEFHEFLQLIRKKAQTIFTITLVGVMVVLLASLVRPLSYGVESRLLVVQNATSADAYSLSRSNEYLGGLLAKVVTSGSFYDQVRGSKYNVDKNYFSGDYSQQLKKWQRTVETTTDGDSGIIEVKVYHPQVAEAKKIALAINDILIASNKEYHGGENVQINIIDQPLASNYPVKPNLVTNGLVALSAFFVFSLFYIYVLPEERYSVYLFGRSKKKRLDNKRPAAKVAVAPELEYYGTREFQQGYEAEVAANPESLSGNMRNIINR